MSNDEFQHINFWNKTNICIKKDKDDKCIISASFQIIDFNQSNKTKLCDEFKKLKNNDKTV